jgi:hypothetical protein
VKYLFQFDFWGDFNRTDPNCAVVDLANCMTFANIMGIQRPLDNVSFMSVLVPDVLLLFSLFVHKTSSIYLGIWE